MHQTGISPYTILLLGMVHLLSLNVQGFRNPDKQREVLHFARSLHVDILFLQECNFRYPLDVSKFVTRFSFPAFFSLSNSAVSGVGIVFLNPSYRRGAHCIFGIDGRTLAVDFTLNHRRVRALIVYAPAQRSKSAAFFQSLDSYLLDPYPTFLVGDFNCVLNPHRDVCGPGQGRAYSGAHALRDLVSQFRLSDAWELKNGNNFVATWARGRSGSRIDKFYFPPELSGYVQSCEVLAFPAGTPRITDHRPLSVRLVFGESVPRSDVWRMDASLFADPDSIKAISASLAATSSGNADCLTWDELKGRWRALLVQAGRDRRVRITRELNDTLRRLRIVGEATR